MRNGLVMALALLGLAQGAFADYTAYIVPAGTSGNQQHTGRPRYGLRRQPAGHDHEPRGV